MLCIFILYIQFCFQVVTITVIREKFAEKHVITSAYQKRGSVMAYVTALMGKMKKNVVRYNIAY